MHHSSNGKTHRMVSTMAGTQPRVEIMTVTPDLAQKWLARNCESNRTISRRTVEAYAREMQAGRWQLTHQAIAFNRSGELIDGQHRLTAVVESGITIKAYVSTGLPLEYNAPIDQGYGRRIDQILGFSPRHVSVLRSLHVLETADLSASFKAQVGLVEELSARHGDFVDAVMKCVQPGLKPPAAFLSACAFAYPIDPERIGQFVEQVHTGEMLSKGAPAYALRKWFMRPDHRTAKENLIASCNAIAALLRGKPIQKFNYGRGEEREGLTGYLTICAKRRALKLEGTPPAEVANLRKMTREEREGI